MTALIDYLRRQVWCQLFIIYTRYLIGGAFVFASVVKIQGGRFTSQSGADEPIHSAFHFFETLYQSGLYWQFLGLGQLVAGGLLMTQRYAKLGAVAFFPIIVNVFVITISYDFAGTPIITGLMLLATCALLLWDWPTLKVLFNLPAEVNPAPRLENAPVWQWVGLATFGFTVVFRASVTYYSIFIWAGVCLALGLLGLVWGLWPRNHPVKN
ncbi:MAG: hypothetical protein MUC97_07640 [Bernardetiaceae bacterium]|jgi:hypothetical protein|nr:hypothetical protein [Bernardetiaceae bacterium]